MPSTTLVQRAPPETVRRLSLAVWGAYAAGEGAIDLKTAARRAGLGEDKGLGYAVELLLRRGHVMKLPGERLAWVATPADEMPR